MPKELNVQASGRSENSPLAQSRLEFGSRADRIIGYNNYIKNNK